jgi:2,4-dienoyl-CoA reductase-like NADH-dependent reductase (Old Yellow Enzyme family)
MKLFDSITLREPEVKNRLWLSPMAMYSANDGVVNDFHLIHYGTRALGGFGLLIAEATGVVPEGRITPGCAGLWNEAQVAAWQPVVKAVHANGAKFAVQLGHAGRKGSVGRPWEALSDKPVPDDGGGWEPVGATEASFPGLKIPRALTTEEVAAIPEQFATAAKRADAAGFDAVEIHAAHGYLIHQFLSPLVNTRTDVYGGTPANRARLLQEIVVAIRKVFSEQKPVLVRVSASDWLPGGLTSEDVAVVVKNLAELGVDFCDTSSGGVLPAPISGGPGYQVPFARAIKDITGIPTGTVGLITEASQAEKILDDGDADVVLIGREALRDPMFPLRAAAALGAEVTWPPQYARAPF